MEMDVKIQDDIKSRYLVLQLETQDTYQEKMIIENRVKGLCKSERRRINNETYFYYEITGFLSVREWFQQKHKGTAGVETVLTGIANAVNETMNFLLDEQGLILDIDYMYVDDKEQMYFVYNPCLHEMKENRMEALFSDLMGCIDYQNRHVVSLVYLLYAQCRKERCTIFQLLESCKKIIETEKEEDDEKRGEPGEGAAQRKAEEMMEIVSEAGEKRYIKKTKKAGFIITFRNWIHRIGKLLESEFGEENLQDEVSEKSEMYERESGTGTSIEKKKGESFDLSETVCIHSNGKDSGEETVMLSGLEKKEYCRLEPLLDSFETIPIHSFPFGIGKEGSKNGYCFSAPVISRKHAKIEGENGVFYLTDLNSTNGTYLNGDQLKPYEMRQIVTGDIVAFADIYFIFTCPKTSNVI